MNRINHYSTLIVEQIVAETFDSNKMDLNSERDFQIDKIGALSVRVCMFVCVCAVTEDRSICRNRLQLASEMGE